MPPRGPDFDKLFKVRPLIYHLQTMYSSLECPSRHLSIYESMIAFKGRSGMKQYISMKPIKRGFKVWELADSASGYLINFEIYTGKNSNNLTEFGLGKNIVLNVSQYLEMKFHIILIIFLLVWHLLKSY